MKYLLSLLLIIPSLSWASCPNDLSSTEYSTGSQAVKTKAGSVCSVTYSYNNVPPGTSITLYDSLSASGTVRLTLTAGASVGSTIKEYPYGAYYGTGIYYSEDAHGTGTVKTDIQYF